MQTAQGRFKIVLRESSYSRLRVSRFYCTLDAVKRRCNHIYEWSLEVKPANDLSNVLKLSFVSENPQLASSILNQLMLQYNNAAIEDKNEINRKILVFYY